MLGFPRLSDFRTLSRVYVRISEQRDAKLPTPRRCRGGASSPTWSCVRSQALRPPEEWRRWSAEGLEGSAVAPPRLGRLQGSSSPHWSAMRGDDRARETDRPAAE